MSCWCHWTKHLRFYWYTLLCAVSGSVSWWSCFSEYNQFNIGFGERGPLRSAESACKSQISPRVAIRLVITTLLLPESSPFPSNLCGRKGTTFFCVLPCSGYIVIFGKSWISGYWNGNDWQQGQNLFYGTRASVQDTPFQGPRFLRNVLGRTHMLGHNVPVRFFPKITGLWEGHSYSYCPN